MVQDGYTDPLPFTVILLSELSSPGDPLEPHQGPLGLNEQQFDVTIISLAKHSPIETMTSDHHTVGFTL